MGADWGKWLFIPCQLAARSFESLPGNLPRRYRCLHMRDTAAIGRSAWRGNFDQRGRPRGTGCGKWVRRTNRLRTAPMGFYRGPDGARGSIGKSTNGGSEEESHRPNDLNTHRQPSPREIFRLASTWLIPGATFWNLDATAGTISRNPAHYCSAVLMRSGTTGTR